MANIGKLIDSLSPIADDVARAVGEFGDDAVRSIMKTTPAMRKRLAALAEKRLESPRATKTMQNQLRTIGNEELDNKVFTNARAVQRLLKQIAPEDQRVKNAVDTIEILATPNQVGNYGTYGLGWPQGILQGFGKKVEPVSYLDSLERQIYGLNRNFSSIENTAPEYAEQAKAVAQKSIDDLVNERRAALEQIISGKELPGLAGLMQGPRIPRLERAVNAVNRLETEEDIVNIPAVIGQLDLAALLRMIGDA